MTIVFWITTVFTERYDLTKVGHPASLFNNILSVLSSCSTTMQLRKRSQVESLIASQKQVHLLEQFCLNVYFARQVITLKLASYDSLLILKAASIKHCFQNVAGLLVKVKMIVKFRPLY